MTYVLPDLRIPHSLLRVCGILARPANTEISNQFRICMKMNIQLKHSRKARRARPRQIEVAFAKQEFNQQICLIVNAACAARGGIARMTLSDWCAVEAELTQEFANGLRLRRRKLSISRAPTRSARAQRRYCGLTATRE